MGEMYIKKNIVLLVTIICLILFFIGCSAVSSDKYDKDDFIGKSSIEIVKKYGEFDCVTMPVCEDGLYKNCRCGYTIKEAKQGFLGASEEVLFFVSFDENGNATECEEGYRPGG